MLLAAISVMQPSKFFFFLDMCELIKSDVVIVNRDASSLLCRLPEDAHVSWPADFLSNRQVHTGLYHSLWYADRSG